jgi:hypothetical protein
MGAYPYARRGGDIAEVIALAGRLRRLEFLTERQDSDRLRFASGG